MLTRTTTMPVGAYALLTEAASALVTTDEMKAHARLDTIPEGDGYMTALVEAATNQAREYTGRAFLTETWTLTLDEWPYDTSTVWWNGVREGTLGMLTASSLVIRKAPFLAVSSVKTVDEDGTLTTFSSANYYTTTESGFGRLALRSGCAWPDMSPPVRQRGGILITFTAGYGTDASDVPAPIRQAVKMIAAHLYETRESHEPPQAALTLLHKYRVMG